MKNKRRKSLGGVVLVTVTIVMFVLIIMLLAALTVVQTAGQRINTKYEENQAYYTARSALDVFTQGMLKDGDLKAYDGSGVRQYTYTKTSVTPAVTDSADMYQGLGLELDLYSLPVVDDSGNLVPGANILQSDLNSSGEAANHIEYQTFFGVADPAVTSITYNITNFPVVSGTNSGYGKMLDGNSTTGYVNATIKVEVLERDYNIDDTKLTDGTYSSKADLLANSTDGAEAVIKGSRKKDTMKVKITATVNYMEYEGIAIVILDTSEVPANNSSKAVTTFGGSGSDNMNIIGGASMADNVNWCNDGVVYGSSYAEKNLTMAVGARVYLAEGESFLVGGDFTVTNANFKAIGSSTTNDDKRAFIYVGGQLKLPNSQATTFTDVDIIAAGGITSDGSNTLYLGNGNVYCKGDLDLSALQNVGIEGKIYVDGDIIVSTDTSGGHAVYYDVDNGIVNIGGVTGSIYLNGNFATGSGLTKVIVPPTSVSVNATNFQTTTDAITLPDINGTSNSIADPLGTDKEKTVNLPGGTKKKVPTHVVNFNHYYMTDGGGQLVQADGTTVITDAFATPPVPVSAEAQAGVAGFSPSTLGITAAAPLVGNIDTSTGTAQKYIISDNRNYNLTITGGGICELVLSGSDWGWGVGFNDTQIIVDDDTTLKVYFDCASGSTFNLAKWKVYTQTTYDAVTNGTLLNVGSVTGHNIKVPKIYYYAPDGSHINIYNGGFLTGYYYGPGSELSTNAGATQSLTMAYNGGSVYDHNGGSTVTMTIVGSVLCHKINFPNNNGIAYINPDLDEDSNPGKPIHDWDAAQYSRT